VFWGLSHNQWGKSVSLFLQNSLNSSLANYKSVVDVHIRFRFQTERVPK
jgi:hypothetical protein